MAGSALTWQLRGRQHRMRVRMTRDLRRLWPILDFARLDETYPAWGYAVTQMVHQYEQDALQRSKDYLEAFYRENGVPGPVPLVTPPAIPDDQIDALLHSGAVAAIKKGSSARQALTVSRSFVTTSQSMARLVRDTAREQTRLTALNDDRFGGWSRIGTGETCAFCQMLISRGAVYSERSVRFASHNNCNCEVQPGYRGESRPVAEYQRSERRAKFDDDQLERDRARVRQWLAVHEVG